MWVASNIGIFELNTLGQFKNYYPVHVRFLTFFKGDLITPVPYGGIRIFKNIDQMDYEYFHDKNHANIPSHVVDVATTSNTVFFASAFDGLFKYNQQTFSSFWENEKVLEKRIKRLCALSEQEIVVVNDFNEVFFIKQNENGYSIQDTIHRDQIIGSTIEFIKHYRDILYIGTNRGINVFYQNKFFLIDEDQGYEDYNSRTAVVDSTGLYIATQSGVFQLKHQYFTQNRTATIDIGIQFFQVNNQQRNDLYYLEQRLLKVAYDQNDIRIKLRFKEVNFPKKLHFFYRLKNPTIIRPHLFSHSFCFYFSLHI